MVDSKSLNNLDVGCSVLCSMERTCRMSTTFREAMMQGEMSEGMSTRGGKRTRKRDEKGGVEREEQRAYHLTLMGEDWR